MNFKNNAISPPDHYTSLNFLPSVFDLQFRFLYYFQIKTSLEVSLKSLSYMYMYM